MFFTVQRVITEISVSFLKIAYENFSIGSFTKEFYNRPRFLQNANSLSFEWFCPSQSSSGKRGLGGTPLRYCHWGES